MSESEDKLASNDNIGHGEPIAMMTWYTYHNYGTALQSSCLYHQIEMLGYRPTLIQYYPKGNTYRDRMTVSLFIQKSIRWVVRHIIGSENYMSEERERLFFNYLGERTTESARCETDEEFARLNGEYKAFVCGSDQIWSPLCFDEKYYLSFVKETNRMVAYAPSIGTFRIEDLEIRNRIKTLVQRFRHLSVREIQGANIIHELTGQDAKVLLDPTMLMDSGEWDEFADTGSVPLISKKYMFCYFLGEQARYKKFVKQVANEWGLQILEVPIKRVNGRFPKIPFEIGPKEFVALIKNASFVCTDSFHGMVFSILYNRPFLAFRRFEENDPRNQNSRVLSLLNLLGMEERLILPHWEDSVNGLREYDYSNVMEKLQLMRNESLEYLRDSLACAVRNK